MKSGNSNREYYSTLGVSRDASIRDIETAFRDRAKRHHPDRGGEEEDMKLLNEAYRVLHDESARAEYDKRFATKVREVTFQPVKSPGMTVDALYGQLAGALISIVIGLVLLLLVRFHWIWVLWPLGILAVLVVFIGVFMAHNVLRMVRESFSAGHPVRKLRWIQETLFWSSVCAGGYGIYLILISV